MTTQQHTDLSDIISDADTMQVGGSHYKDMGMQPWAVMEAVLTTEEFIGFLKGNIIKYAMRQGRKGEDDGDKGLHYEAKLRQLRKKLAQELVAKYGG